MATPQPLPAPQAYRQSEVDHSDRLSNMRQSHPRYVYAHHWQSWAYTEITDGGKVVAGEDLGRGLGVGQWVPVLHKIYIRKGLSGASTNQDVEAPIANAIRKGATVIRAGDARLGPWADYLRIYRDMSGAVHYVEQTETAVRLPSGETVLRPNEQKYHAFVAHIRDAGVVDPMSPIAYEAIRTKAEAELEYLREAATRTGSSPQLERKSRILAAMDAAWAAEQERQAGLAGPGVELEVEVIDAPPEELTAAEAALARSKRGKR
jgi:hypothetical protein